MVNNDYLNNRRQDAIDEKRKEKETTQEGSKIIIDCLDKLVVDDDAIDRKVRAKESEEIESKKQDLTEKFKKSGAVTRWTFDTFNSAKWPVGYNNAKALVDSNDNGLFCGKSGCGKSHLLNAIGWACIDRGKYVYRLIETDLRRAWSEAINYDGTRLQGIIEKAKKCDILAYDELGKFRLTDGKIDGDIDGEYFSDFGGVVYTIINYRTERQKRTIATVQASDQQKLMERVGYSIIRRFMRVEDDKENCIKSIYKKEEV